MNKRNRLARMWSGRWPVLFITALALLAEAPLSTHAQQRPTRQYQPPAQPPGDAVGPTVVISPDEDYRIGASDVIEIVVGDAPELSRTFRVSADGAIAMPFLGRLSARHKTAQELAQEIADRLRGEYLNDPEVTVTIKQINSRSFFIHGAVRRPGLYQIEGRPSLLKLITVAGGLNEDHGSTAFILHELNAEGDTPDQSPQPKDKAETPEQGTVSDSDQQENARYDLKRVNISGLLKGSFDQNTVIQPSDIVYIPPADVFFVAGEVNSPGSFPLKEGTTLRQAISLSQGMTFNAAPVRGLIFREEAATGDRKEIKIDIGAVMSGRKEDIQIQANDIIIVPNSRVKSVTSTVLRAFGVNAWRVYGRN